MAVSVLVLAFTGSGCAAVVPASGSPRLVGDNRGRDTLSQPYVRLIAEPPKKDAPPEKIVEGFQSAMASFDDPQLTVARQYLTEAASRTWRPWQQTKVYADGKFDTVSAQTEPPEAAEQAVVTLKGTAHAVIDHEGRYTAATGPVMESFQLVKEQGQWRISALPDIRLLSVEDVLRAYRPVDLYYPPATKVSGLVVDRVWAPIDSSRGLPETLIRRLLAGPTSSIRDAVVNVFPNEVDLNQIAIEGDTVVVDFSSAVELVPSEQLSAMKAQLVWTLGDLVTGRTVEIRVNGEPFLGSGLRFKLSDYAAYDPNVVPSQAQAYFMQSGRLHRVKEKGGGELVAGAAGEQATPFHAPAVSGEARPRVAALVGDDGVYVTSMIHGSQWQRWITGADLSRPCWDRYGAVWAAERIGPKESRVWQAVDGQARGVLAAKELTSGKILDLRVSRDGARVAVIMDDDSGTVVKIGTVVRIGEQVRIDEVHTLIQAQEGQEIRDIAWQDATNLLVLAKGKGGQELALWSVMEGIPVSDADIKLTAQTKIESITSIPDHVLAGTDQDGGKSTGDREVRGYSIEKKTWTTLAENGASEPVYPLG